MPGTWDLDWTSPLGKTGVMLGWVPGQYTPDDGVPADVCPILARGLCANHTVVGRSKRVPHGVGPEWTPAPDGAACCHRREWWRPWAYDYPLVATRDPSRVEGFLDEAYFSWSMQGQQLLLSSADRVPTLDLALLEGLAERPFRVTPEQLGAAGLSGVVMPSVDGVTAGVYVPEPSVREALVEALAHATWMAGGEFLETDEEQLSLWLQAGFARGDAWKKAWEQARRSGSAAG